MTIGTTRSSGTGTELSNGLRIYPWSASAVIPEASWLSTECGAEAFVRAVRRVGSTDVVIPTLARDGIDCVNRATRGGMSATEAAAACNAGGPGGAPTRVETPPRTLDADLTLYTQRDADAYRCVTHLEGSLTIEGREALVSLPRLREVTGDLSVTLTGIDSASGTAYGRVDLPRLRTVGRSVRLVAARWSTPGARPTADFGLFALEDVELDVEVSLGQFNTEATGLANLTTVHGDVRLSSVRSGDLFAPGLLEALDHVQGDLTLVGGFTVGNLFSRLQRVDGDVLLDDHTFLGSTVLPRLEHVGGSLTLRDAGFVTLFDRLALVGGALTLESTGRTATPSRVGSATLLRVGALSVLRTRHDTSPVHGSSRVGAGGAIRFVDNADLCTSEASSYVTVQRGAGWTGTSELTGNEGC